MKVLGLSGGSVNGNSEILLKCALQAAQEAAPKDTEINFIRIPEMSIPSHLQASDLESAKGAIEEIKADLSVPDDRPFALKLIMEADIIIFSCPIYSRVIPGIVKHFQDKTMGPFQDTAMVRFRRKMQGGTYTAEDDLLFKPRVAGLIAVGGAERTEWTPFGLPIMQQMWFSMGVQVVSQFQVHSCGLPGSVLLNAEAIRKAEELGRALVSQAGKENAEFLGEHQGACPLCHLDMIIMMPGNEIECATCGSRGRLVVRTDASGEQIVSAAFDEAGQKLSPFRELGKEIHLQEIRRISENLRPQMASVQKRREELKVLDDAWLAKLPSTGHKVTIFRSSSVPNEVFPGVVHLTPNITSVLERLGVSAESVGGGEICRVNEYAQNGTQISSVDYQSQGKMWQSAWRIAKQLKLFNELLSVVTTKNTAGDTLYSVQEISVVDLDVEKGTVVLENREKFTGDLIVGADGILSHTRSKAGVPKQAWVQDERDSAAKNSGTLTCWIEDDRISLACLGEEDNSVHLYSVYQGDDHHFKDTEKKTFLQQAFSGIPHVKALASSFDASNMVVDRVYQMKSLDNWTQSRFVLLGNAAYTLAPALFQGLETGMAIEDAVSLATILSTNPLSEEIPARLKLCEECRMARVTKIKSMLDSRMTSRTLLNNLLPNDSFAFAAPGTVAEATLTCTTLDKMEWLGGSGYDMTSLMLHGVRYTKKDGSSILGSFLTLMFENLADPILSGREEAGFPKLFCDIDVRDEKGSFEVSASWRGQQFGKLAWEDLKESEDPNHAPEPETSETQTQSCAAGKEIEKEKGVFVYRYIPRVGERGKPDDEYVVLAPPPNRPAVSTALTRRAVAQGARISFDARNWKELPTLHHTASRLAEIPVLEVVRAQIVESTGVDDLSAAFRLDKG
ncbi:hypothetical protein G7Y89_g11613 [Cudoniella acicularis]|uniref:NADPH-dependent FMN reductase-like domain-containing protein n=1 Tax=Cudoniella acicularis TaxID=354080 RepID=A0A8H4VXP9_9HELO|nr:hypothetical protein G7Y89_g11613 [Cudoniella acicularis]